MKKFFTLALLLSLACTSLRAQGWERIIGHPGYEDQARSITATPDGGFLVGGWSYGDTIPFGQPANYVVKLNSGGDKEWEYLRNDSVYTQVHDVLATPNGDFILSSSANGKAYIAKLNSTGSIVWEKYPSTSNGINYGSDLIESNDGGYVFTGSTNLGGGNLDAYVYKLDANGDSVWVTQLGSSEYESGINLVKVTDGYVLSGKFIGTSGLKGYIAKLDWNGNVVWEKRYGSQISAAISIDEASDGSLYWCGTILDSIEQVYLMKLNALGDSVWSKNLTSSNSRQAKDLKITSNDEMYLLTKSMSIQNYIDTEVLKLDATGNQLWSRNYGGNNADVCYELTTTPGGGFAFCGLTASYGFTEGKFYVVKADQNGDAFLNRISGTVFKDGNLNCFQDNNEDGLYTSGSLYWLVKMVPGPFGNESFYTTTQPDGSFNINCDTGNYTLSAIPVNDLWSSTCTNRSVSFTGFMEHSTDNDFGFTTVNNCSRLSVDVTSSRIRACMGATYYVNYCNNGTSDATDTKIRVVLPAEFTVTSFSFPWDSVDGNQLFYTIGDLAAATCHSFTISGTTSCSVINGQTLCSEAEISSSDQCTLPSAFWDRSSIQVTGSCNGDTAVCFTITNTGSGSMDASSQWRLYSNNELAQTGAFQLNANESTELCFVPNGTTLRLEADQRPDHPGNSHPRYSIELCGENNTATGYILQAPEDDQDDFVEVSCTQVTGSFDPNDKTVVPQGITENNYISAYDQLEYTIRFQNTGNDTAFNILIVDSLNPDVYDIASLTMSNASHSFVLEISNAGIATWTFADIMLPDSNVNEPKSHGFVKFKIKQKISNQKGTRIENTAQIYFDFNSPIATNEAYNTISDTMLSGSPLEQLGIEGNSGDPVRVMVNPNPFVYSTTFNLPQVNNNGSQTRTLNVFNALGELVFRKKIYTNHYLFERKGLESGLYHYQILLNDQPEYSGKLMIHE